MSILKTDYRRPEPRVQMSNHLLDRLSANDLALLAPSLETVPFVLNERIANAGQIIEHAYFPDSGILTFVAGAGAAQIEVAIIGSEGMTGVPIVLSDGRSVFDVHAHADGQARRVRADDLREAMAQSPSLHGLLLRYAQVLLIQIAHTALANSHANIEQRAARWLLMAHDRVRADELRLTHEFLARVLAVRRPGVTEAFHALEGRGLIKAARGALTIIDREGLEELAGPVYGAAEAEYRRLIG